MPEPHAPNFFVVGAPKAGTTSLYHYLDQHPAIYMSPIKEPAFFAPEVIDFTAESRAAYEADARALREYLDGPMDQRRGHGIVTHWADYLKLFRNAGSASARGEVSGNYLPSAAAPASIRSRIPHARIIMILRNPIERLFSQYASAVSAGAVGEPFGEWVTGQERAESGRSPRYGPIWTGMYAQHVRRYRASFPEDQLRIYLYEDYRDRPAAVLQDVFRFLGVDDTFAVDARVRHNVTTAPRWPWLAKPVRVLKPALEVVLPRGLWSRARTWYRQPARLEMSASERTRLVDIYREDMSELQELIGRDLSAWLEVAR